MNSRCGWRCQFLGACVRCQGPVVRMGCMAASAVAAVHCLSPCNTTHPPCSALRDLSD
jgi:hypothetical protein